MESLVPRTKTKYTKKQLKILTKKSGKANRILISKANEFL